jgi:chaperonin GroEL
MAKQVIFHEDVRRRLKDGVDTVANAVRVTLGPRGRNVALDKGYGGPTITNDGVSIAKEISLKDKFQNMGAEVVKQVANKTNENAGDGTTTAVVLTQAIVSEGLKRTSMGANAVMVRRGIEAATKDVVEELRSMAKEIKSPEEIEQVATISAESAELGKTIAETIGKVGKDGVVTVEESPTFGIEKEIVEGLEFDRGYISAYMVTNPERMEAEYKDPLILITDKKIAALQEILPLLEKLATTGRKDLVILAEEVEGEALATFVVNKLRGGFNALAVKAPGYGDRKKEYLQDIAVLTGGTVISEEVGLKFDKVELSMLGRASRVVASKDRTLIIGGKGKKDLIEKRIAEIRQVLRNTDSKFDREKLEERVAKLTGGVAVLRVGAATETEMKYLKDKIEDAVNATKAAIEEGIIPGGGTALVKIAEKLKKELAKNMKGDAKHDIEYVAGYNILLNSLYAPLRQIAHNAGFEDSAAVIVDMVVKGKPVEGFDAGNIEGDPALVNMLERGIIDPVKVTRSCVQNAASAAAILLTTEAAVAEEPEEKKEMPMPPGGMGGMDY